MRLEQLQIGAFGPFTNFHLAFPRGAHDLHLLLGQNEAGKSSLLRAIRDLLFGIPARSADTFLHEGKRLRIGATIGAPDGRQFEFQRRKGNKSTLLDGAGKELPDSALEPWLGAIDGPYFSAMFGLGSDELREGARELLRGQGELGKALFSASLGGHPLQKVLDRMTEEADRIFRGKGSVNVLIRPAVQKLKELTVRYRELSIRPDDWEQNEKAIAGYESELQLLSQRQQELARELEWLVRCQDAWPSVEKLAAAERRLAEFPPTPTLAADFVARVRKAIAEISQFEEQSRRVSSELFRSEEKILGFCIRMDVLAEATALEQLTEELGAWQKQVRKLKQLRLEVDVKREALRLAQDRAGLTGTDQGLAIEATTESFRMGTAARLACEQAAVALETSLEQLAHCGRELADCRAVLEENRRDLASLPASDPGELREALAIANQASEVFRALASDEQAIRSTGGQLETAFRQLNSSCESHAQAAGLSVPGKATIRRFREEFGRLQLAIAQELRGIEEGRRRIESIQAEISRLTRQQEIPTVEDLANARKHRETGWQSVLRAWESGQKKGEAPQDPWADDRPLAVAYPAAVEAADRIADELFRDAATVEQLTEKRLQIEKSERLNEAASARIRQLEAELAAGKTAWQELWAPAGLVAASPDEMEEWRDHWNLFVQRWEEQRDAQRTLVERKSLIETAASHLAIALGWSSGKGFPILHDEAARRMQELERAEGQRVELIRLQGRLESRIRQLELEECELTSSAERGKVHWKELTTRHGLPADCPPSMARELIKEREELLRLHSECRKLELEAVAAENDSRSFEQETIRLGKLLGLPEASVEATARGLGKLLEQARRDEAICNELKASLPGLQAEQIRLRDLQQAADQGLASLMSDARIDDQQDLEPLLGRLERKRELEIESGQLKDFLADLSRGEHVTDFLERVAREESATLTLRTTTLRQEQADCRVAEESLRSSRQSALDRRRQMEGQGGDAADARQEAEMVAASVVGQAGRFVRLKMAIQQMNRQIERFRMENQGPLLERSGQLFQAITCGAFSGLRPDFNDTDEPVIAGVRSDQRLVPVHGMSEGTRDQLYLALRLAALERYLEQHAPMPLILDDLLITFDDERAMAILKLLRELAGRTQVLLFTHHRHVVDLCRESLGADGFFLHDLGSQADASVSTGAYS